MRIEQQIIPYLNANATDALNIADFSSAALQVTCGAYNHNYHLMSGVCLSSASMYTHENPLIKISL